MACIIGASFFLPGFSQCIKKDILWKRIVFLRDSSAQTSSSELNELLGYLKTVSECKQENDSVHVLLLQRIGWLYADKNNYYQAIKYEKKAVLVNTNSESGKVIHPQLIVKCYFSLGIYYDSLKIEAKKIEAFDSCLANVIRLNTGYEISKTVFAEKIKKLFSSGDYHNCIYYADLGDKIISANRNDVEDADANLFFYFHIKINALIMLNKLAEARLLLSAEIKKEERSKRITNMGTLLGLYGLVLKNDSSPGLAIQYFKKAFYYFKKNGYEPGCSEMLNNIGTIYSGWLYKNDLALYYFFKALQYKDADENLDTYKNIANLYLKQVKYDSVFYYFQQSFNQIKPGFSETDLLRDNLEFEVKIKDYISILILDKADAYLNQYKMTGNKQSLQSAIKIYKTADLYFDKIKNEQSEIQSKLFWKTNNRRLYEHALEACLALGNKEDAFYFFEKSRSVLLGDQVNEQRGLRDDELTKQAQLKKSIATLERSINDTLTTSREVDIIKQELFTQKQQLEKIKASSGLSNRYLSTSAIPTISQVQQRMLAGNKVLIELFYGDSAVYVISLSTGSTYFTKINKKIYDSLTEGYIAFIANPELLNKNFTRFAAVSNGLYKLIFGNTTLPATGSIIISPDGKSFPFEALVTNQNFQSPIYLLMNYATSYTYSARYLLGVQNENKAEEASLLGIAPVVFKSGLNLPALNGSDLSLKRISNYFSTEASFAFDSATSTNFSRQFASYSILQLYAHAAENGNGSDPVIYFADKPFYLSDLVTERQPVTRLVVLSACETARGKFYGGEGVFSFNRGFAALGIPAAISNLWSADDESTYRLTELFYKFLSKGMPTDVAIQQAKIEFISTSATEEKKLPYFWAGTILTGRAETFKMGNNNVYYWLVVISAILAVIVVVVVAKKPFRGKKTKAVDKPDTY